jgi:hypothetical protein
MKVIPINFNTEHKVMLGHAKMLLEDGFIAIDPCFDSIATTTMPYWSCLGLEYFQSDPLS